MPSYTSPEAPSNGIAIVPANTALTRPISALYVGVTGNVVVDFASGTANNVVFQAVPAGTTLKFRVNMVRSTTTANGLVGLY